MLNKLLYKQLEQKKISTATFEEHLKNYVSGFPFLKIVDAATPDRGIHILSESQIIESIRLAESYNGDLYKFVPASGAASRMFKDLYEANEILSELENSKTIYENSCSISNSSGTISNSSRSLSNNSSSISNSSGSISNSSRSLSNNSGLLPNAAKVFLDNFREFPFCGDSDLLNFVLYNKGLNYGSMPKGLIKFHKYNFTDNNLNNNLNNNSKDNSKDNSNDNPNNNSKDNSNDNYNNCSNNYVTYSRTAFEEHLVEGALYAKNHNKIVNISFTVSPEHMNDFKQLYSKVKDKYQDTYDCIYNINFSTQSPSTDIIAVDENNSPFIIENGKYLFRPGGHGALLKNLNKIKSNIIIIKNIDNVVKENHIYDTIKWKKVLIGRAILLQQQIFSYIGLLNDYKYCDNKDNKDNNGNNGNNGNKDNNDNNDNNGNINNLKPIIKFLKDEFCIEMPDSALSLPVDKLKKLLMAKLNRPLRICGMVKNQGEPGGGPFIIRNNDGSTSLQILESAQINMSDKKSALAVSHSTHFNPVDIVCAVNNYKGEKFNLQKFSDPATGFISSKSYQGRKLKAQELPGLWNGSMSDWNTQFVEVPISTFNPVKTVVDLLRPMHRD